MCKQTNLMSFISGECFYNITAFMFQLRQLTNSLNLYFYLYFPSSIQTLSLQGSTFILKIDHKPLSADMDDALQSTKTMQFVFAPE